jgi:hypothetical protein
MTAATLALDPIFEADLRPEQMPPAPGAMPRNSWTPMDHAGCSAHGRNPIQDMPGETPDEVGLPCGDVRNV